LHLWLHAIILEVTLLFLDELAKTKISQEAQKRQKTKNPKIPQDSQETKKSKKPKNPKICSVNKNPENALWVGILG